MSSQMDELLLASMTLSLEERAQLAGRLLLSIENPTDAEVERLWLDEAERRLNAFRIGDSQAIPSEEVFRQAIADLS
jgi:putative addiction module component (TIGR02574 family)